MYSICPKCNHPQSGDQSSRDKCESCGLVFSKYLKSLAVDYQPAVMLDSSPVNSGWLAAAPQFLLRRRSNIGKAEFGGYLLLWMVFVFWGLDFVLMDFHSDEIGRSWFHNVNLVFHEAGHVIFRPFGRTMMILGGSLFQVLLPLILMFAFLITNKDGFAASLCLWWSGQSMMDVAPYIADARALRLPLLGGGTGADSPGMHDWANLLRPRGWLEYDLRIAAVVDALGSGLLLIALVWGGFILLLYRKEVMRKS
jgi:hypothetical protein